MRAFRPVVTIIALGALAMFAQSQSHGATRISLLMATGMPGSSFYHNGLSMASMWTTKLRDIGIRVSAAVSEGSLENLEAIRIGDADIVLADELFCAMAQNGVGLFKGRTVKELRSIGYMWPEALHLVIRSNKATTGTIQDVNGLTMTVEPADSGARFIIDALMKDGKGNKFKIRRRPMNYVSAAEALRRGDISVFTLMGGLPSTVVTSLLADMKTPLTFLNVPSARVEAVQKEYPTGMIQYAIPAGTYPNQPQPVNTIAQRSVLCVAASLDAPIVYALTKALFENLEQLGKSHPAMRNITMETAVQGLSVPLHKGAVQYYREKNITVPAQAQSAASQARK